MKLADFDLIFIPSPSDFSEYEGDNAYYCGLEIIKADIYELEGKLRRCYSSNSTIEEKNIVPGIQEKVLIEHKYRPELFIEISVFLASGTVTSLFINFLTNWVNAKNGRKMKIRLKNGFEFEATQLTRDEFIELFSELYEKYGTDEPLTKKGSPIIYLNDTKEKRLNLLQDEINLDSAYFKKLEEILNKENKKK